MVPREMGSEQKVGDKHVCLSRHMHGRGQEERNGLESKRINLSGTAYDTLRMTHSNYRAQTFIYVLES